MTKEELLSRIQKKAKKLVLASLPRAIIFLALLILFVVLFFQTRSDPDGVPTWGILIMFLGALFMSWLYLKIVVENIPIAIHPEKSPLFIKHGSPEKVASIITAATVNLVLRVDKFTISNDYIYDGADNVFACKDVLEIYKQVYRVNGVTTGYYIVLTDKYRDTMKIPFAKYTLFSNPIEKEVDNTIAFLAHLCPNAVVGYNKENQDYINKNAIDLVSGTSSKDSIEKPEDIFIGETKTKTAGNLSVIEDSEKATAKQSAKSEGAEERALPVRKFCSTCGAKLVPGARYCNKCGKSIV